MDCPVCKYPNQAGATHCGMCYEVFNRSAAQSYMHAVKRERREAEGVPDDPQAMIKSQKMIEETTSVFAKIDWPSLIDAAVALFHKSKIPLLIGVLLIVLWMAARFLFSEGLWFHLFGEKLAYAFPSKTSTQYLVGTQQTVKSWSERQGRLDTPMEDFKIEEMGNILVDGKSSSAKSQSIVDVHTKEWIQILNDGAGAASHTLPKNHPTLIGGRLVFDKKGVLQERRVTLSPRIGKSLSFLTPRFPKGSLRHGRTWDEEVAWLDVYNDWKIYWTGTFHWTAGDLESCGDHSCLKLTYQADLQPHLRGGPSWMQGIGRGTNGRTSTDGVASFDVDSHEMRSNTFSYEGLLHMPISDLGRIPWELRIGRGVKGQPGEILIRFENKIDIRKN